MQASYLHWHDSVAIETVHTSYLCTQLWSLQWYTEIF